MIQHVSDLVGLPAIIPRISNLTVLPGSTISCRSDNHQREHFFSSVGISFSRGISQLHIPERLAACIAARALACLAPAGPPWISRCVVRVFHPTCCFIPLNKGVGLW